MYQTDFKSILVLAIVAVSQAFNVNACNADAICPHTYLFAIDGLHYYSAVKCTPTPCTEIPIQTLLVYDQRVTNLGCEQTGPNSPTPDCQCKTSLVPVGTYDVYEDLSKYYDETARSFIRNDHFVGTQIGNATVYFRTLTFVTQNSAGVTQEQSIAVPISANALNAIVKTGLNGSEVVVYQSSFDGWNVVLGGKPFRAVLANRQFKKHNHVSAYSK